MFLRFLYAIAVAVIVGLVCYVLGALIAMTPMVQIGLFLKDHASLIGIIGGICYFFFGNRPPLRPAV